MNECDSPAQMSSVDSPWDSNKPCVLTLFMGNSRLHYSTNFAFVFVSFVTNIKVTDMKNRAGKSATWDQNSVWGERGEKCMIYILRLETPPPYTGCLRLDYSQYKLFKLITHIYKLSTIYK